MARARKGVTGYDKWALPFLSGRDKRIPLYYREYEGNRHDSKVFLQVMEDMFGAMRGSVGEDAVLTVVFDKGMNSEDDIAAIDTREDINFITTYSTYFAEDLVHVNPDNFTVVDTVKNRKLAREGKADDRLPHEHFAFLPDVITWEKKACTYAGRAKRRAGRDHESIWLENSRWGLIGNLGLSD